MSFRVSYITRLWLIYVYLSASLSVCLLTCLDVSWCAMRNALADWANCREAVDWLAIAYIKSSVFSPDDDLIADHFHLLISYVRYET